MLVLLLLHFYYLIVLVKCGLEPIQKEFLISTQESDSKNPYVASLANGNYLVGWENNDPINLRIKLIFNNGSLINNNDHIIVNNQYTNISAHVRIIINIEISFLFFVFFYLFRLETKNNIT